MTRALAVVATLALSACVTVSPKPVEVRLGAPMAALRAEIGPPLVEGESSRRGHVVGHLVFQRGMVITEVCTVDGAVVAWSRSGAYTRQVSEPTSEPCGEYPLASDPELAAR